MLDNTIRSHLSIAIAEVPSRDHTIGNRYQSKLDTIFADTDGHIAKTVKGTSASGTTTRTATASSTATTAAGSSAADATTTC